MEHYVGATVTFINTPKQSTVFSTVLKMSCLTCNRVIFRVICLISVQIYIVGNGPRSVLTSTHNIYTG